MLFQDALERRMTNLHDPVHQRLPRQKLLRSRKRRIWCHHRHRRKITRTNGEGLALEEATKALKSISSFSTSTTRPAACSSDAQRDQLRENLQNQLDQLRASQSTALKVLRLSR